MMESQNRKRAPAWTEQKVRDLIAVWGEESVLSELCSSFRNAKTFVKISQGMKDRGRNRDLKQCRVKLKELRQAYQKTREANGRSGSEPQTCCFYDELHAILGGSATTTPTMCFDSISGEGGNTEAGFGEKEDSSQQASGETGFPDSQELFLTLDLDPVPPEPTQGCLLDLPGGEGTSGGGKGSFNFAKDLPRVSPGCWGPDDGQTFCNLATDDPGAHPLQEASQLVPDGEQRAEVEAR
ncbi:Zinc finger and SCAN domain-containing protein 29 [Chelonia mydas]|uniref:Zinc finger and SCAN domain-containing protein 29 n=1 Tax=Chelonia mydas TaxID=8469 RepID=M7AX21_CHEMY|nr:Zinc finger and SCAN domain-containing protein 29 [Chelonia mydas]